MNPQFDTVVDVTLGSTSLFRTPGSALIRPDWIMGSGLGGLSIDTYGKFAFAEDANLALTGRIEARGVRREHRVRR